MTDPLEPHQIDAELARLDSLDVTEHPAVFDEIHQALRDDLTGTAPSSSQGA
jgi:hypothetical protein